MVVWLEIFYLGAAQMVLLLYVILGAISAESLAGNFPRNFPMVFVDILGDIFYRVLVGIFAQILPGIRPGTWPGFWLLRFLTIPVIAIVWLVAFLMLPGPAGMAVQPDSDRIILF